MSVITEISLYLYLWNELCMHSISFPLHIRKSWKDTKMVCLSQPIWVGCSA